MGLGEEHELVTLLVIANRHFSSWLFNCAKKRVGPVFQE